MDKLKIRLKWHNLTAVIVIAFVAVAFAKGTLTKPAEQARPDIVMIDSMKKFGNLERPEVMFLHDKHTAAVEESGKDCSVCHREENQKLSQKFMVLEYEAADAVMNNFHDNCLGCHEETSALKKKSGPLACADCHHPEPGTASSRQPMGLDNSLHYRHIKAYDNSCKECHTDCKSDVHKEGEETTCRHCHFQEKTDEGVISLKEAVHESCISCHITRAKEEKDTGPVKCAGCHDLEAQNAVSKVSPVPRLNRKQPDAVMMKTGSPELDLPGKNRMDFVAFDHKLHEASADTCRVCHHKAMSACNECHTVAGSEKSANVTLEQAMHKMGENQSCLGCHAKMQEDPRCAGCHAAIPEKASAEDRTCLTCHAKLPEGMMPDNNLAAVMISQRNGMHQVYDAGDIPEKIVIGEFSDQYEPVDFPHAKIIDTMIQDIADDKLASYFHSEKGTLCQGCHHNSPASKKPSSCRTCHVKPFDEANMGRPGILGAYHIQCMECHNHMKIDKVGCTDCHKEKK